nr:hypothetical protein [Nocardia niwae]
MEISTSPGSRRPLPGVIDRGPARFVRDQFNQLLRHDRMIPTATADSEKSKPNQQWVLRIDRFSNTIPPAVCPGAQVSRSAHRAPRLGAIAGGFIGRGMSGQDPVQLDAYRGCGACPPAVGSSVRIRPASSRSRTLVCCEAGPQQRERLLFTDPVHQHQHPFGLLDPPAAGP